MKFFAFIECRLIKRNNLFRKYNQKLSIKKYNNEQLISLLLKKKDYNQLNKLILERNYKYHFTDEQANSIFNEIKGLDYAMLFRLLIFIDYTKLNLENTTKCIYILSKRHIDINKHELSPTLNEKSLIKYIEVPTPNVHSLITEERHNPEINIWLALSIFNINRYKSSRLIYYLISALTIDNNSFIYHCHDLINLYNLQNIDPHYDILIRSSYIRHFILKGKFECDLFNKKLAQLEENKYFINYTLDSLLNANQLDLFYKILISMLDSAIQGINATFISVLLCRRFFLTLLTQGRLNVAITLYNNVNFYNRSFGDTNNEILIPDIIRTLFNLNKNYIDISFELMKIFNNCIDQDMYDLFFINFMIERKDLNLLIRVMTKRDICNSKMVYYYLNEVGYEKLFHLIKSWYKNQVHPCIISDSLYRILILPLKSEPLFDVVEFIINEKLPTNSLIMKIWIPLHLEFRKIRRLNFSYFKTFILLCMRYDKLDINIIIHDISHLEDRERAILNTMISNYQFNEGKHIREEYIVNHDKCIVDLNGVDIIFDFGLDLLFYQNWFVCFSRLIYLLNQNIYPDIGSLKYIVNLLVSNQKYDQVIQLYQLLNLEFHTEVLGFQDACQDIFSNYVLAFSVLSMKTIAVELVHKMLDQYCFVKSDVAIEFLKLYQEDRNEMNLKAKFVLKEMKYFNIVIEDILLEFIVDNLVDLKCIDSTSMILNFLITNQITINEPLKLKFIKIAIEFKNKDIIDSIHSTNFKNIELYNQLLRFSLLIKSQLHFDYYENLMVRSNVLYDEFTYMLLLAGYTQLDEYQFDKAMNLLFRLEKTNLFLPDHFILLIKNITFIHGDKETGQKLYYRMLRLDLVEYPTELLQLIPNYNFE